MFYFSDAEIDRYINEDLPYFDLTTNLASSDDLPVLLEFISRDNGVLSGTEEAAKVFKKLGCNVRKYKKTATNISSGEVIMSVTGVAEAVFSAWKVAQNILEYASGVATLTNKIVNVAKNINPSIQIVATRKIMPGAKKILTKAIVGGGAMPHRLGLSESVLFFAQHIELMGGWSKFEDGFAQIKLHAGEKKIIIEVEELETAMRAANVGADIIQIDKAKPCEIQTMIRQAKIINPQIIVSVAGGINISNVADYASTGADILVTSSLYHAKPLDITTKITKSE